LTAARRNGPMAAMRELDILFTPLTLRSITLRNRFVMPGMQRGFMDDGAPTPKMVAYLRRCAAGGAGLIISESTSPDHPSAYWMPMMGRMETRTLGAWKQVVDAVRGAGAAFFLQIWHPGAMRKVAEEHPLAKVPALSPSGLIQGGRHNGRAMTRDDLQELKLAYVRAAEHAQSAPDTRQRSWRPSARPPAIASSFRIDSRSSRKWTTGPPSRRVRRICAA
jgi:2,4-dienoyl-CoA reductase-like NADH-dependent reductase (Old Yellow Enzyme family)